MPKRAILLVLLVLGAATGTAGSVELRPGLEVGGSLVWLDYDREIEVWDPGSRLDFHMAATLMFEFGSRGSVIAGLRYSGLGNEVDYDESTIPGQDPALATSGTFSVHQRYLGIPIAARWDLYSEGGPFLFGGFETAYLLGADLDWSERATPASPVEEGSEDIGDALSDFNVNVFIGGGLALAVADHEVELSVRYAYGLTDPADSEDWFSGWATQELAIGVGFRL
jgi:hypothetical protein